jgi:cobalt-zinc-cadmium efflux system protein
MAAEVVVGILTHSLARLSDAAHMLTDAGALVLPLVVIRLMRRPAGGNLTFGLQRSEILSAQANGGTMHILTDLIAFIVTAIAGAVIVATGWTRADGVAALFVALVMLHSASGLLRDSGRVLLEAAPEGMDVEPIGDALAADGTSRASTTSTCFGIQHTTLQVDHAPEQTLLSIEPKPREAQWPA